MSLPRRKPSPRPGPFATQVVRSAASRLLEARLDRLGRILQARGGGWELALGEPPDGLAGRSLIALAADASAEEGWRERLRRAWSSSEAIDGFVTTMRHRDGATTVTVEGTIARHRARRGEDDLHLLLWDVTPQHRRIARLEEAVRIAAHELRGPVGGLKVSLDVLAGRLRADDETCARLLAAAQRAGDRAVRLISSLLDVEALRTGARPLSLAAVGTRDVTREAVEEASALARERGVRIEDDVPDGEHVVADRLLLLEVLGNLLSNAISVSEAEATVRIATSRPTSDTVRFSVVDRGPGIPGEVRERVFEAFFRVKRDGCPAPRGLGLGLALAREIVERHDGTIELETQEGVGTSFHATFPVGGPAAADPGPGEIVPAQRRARSRRSAGSPLPEVHPETRR